MSFTRFRPLIIPGLALALSACLFDPIAPGRADKGQGEAVVQIKTGAVGALGKASAVQAIDLNRLIVDLSADGEVPIHDTLALSGNGDQTLNKTYTRLVARKTWTVSARSVDRNAVVIHSGVTSFSVDPGKSAKVNLALAPLYSMLKAAFFPIVEGVRKLEIAVDGQVRADTTLSSGSHVGDTVRLNFDYLGVGTRHIALNVYGLDAMSLMFSGDTTLNIAAGQKTSLHLRLRGLGNAEMTVVLGVVGEVDIDGVIDDGIACSGSSPGSWSEDFNGTALGSDWSVFQYAGLRHNGQSSPANHYDLSRGRLRYILDPMTQSMYTHEPWFDGTWYWYDPGLDLSRPVGGIKWTVETKVSWYVPRVVNAAGFPISVHFGPDSNGYDVGFMRYSNDDVSAGSNPDHNFFYTWAGNSTWSQWATLETNITRWIRIDRDGENMTLRWSSDSLSWIPLSSGKIPPQFQCAEQNFHIMGNAWFSPMGSYADYDYVTFSRER